VDGSNTLHRTTLASLRGLIRCDYQGDYAQSGKTDYYLGSATYVRFALWNPWNRTRHPRVWGVAVWSWGDPDPCDFPAAPVKLPASRMTGDANDWPGGIGGTCLSSGPISGSNLLASGVAMP
jgi:hypothetical protein